ncbi:uncharacterized protein PHACADRAFT_252415 [Phanerochaete carnosa HHB-10118-sp]|uniref:DUF6533 domain-containing protein n=1 Tax=Phanerochaete carnosa (strain HHB-10118-sp) TaxID=650164 RepID=K5WGK6_PHACS|nr:uncharacterized protein PHACADRAFT_252415 [Phanerochaete carnosa HHB-10118-sp]EKM58239.1 hypothetical protein PHACADRAFT_252415 [Phanerochaete carnosa HHB-10118-sp]
MSREIDLVWRQKWRASTAIYFLLRYPVVAFQIFNVYASSYTTPQYASLSQCSPILTSVLFSCPAATPSTGLHGPFQSYSRE